MPADEYIFYIIVDINMQKEAKEGGYEDNRTLWQYYD